MDMDMDVDVDVEADDEWCPPDWERISLSDSELLPPRNNGRWGPSKCYEILIWMYLPITAVPQRVQISTGLDAHELVELQSIRGLRDLRSVGVCHPKHPDLILWRFKNNRACSRDSAGPPKRVPCVVHGAFDIVIDARPSDDTLRDGAHIAVYPMIFTYKFICSD